MLPHGTWLVQVHVNVTTMGSKGSLVNIFLHRMDLFVSNYEIQLCMKCTL